MKLDYTPDGGAPTVHLHELGVIYLMGEESAFTPDDFPQKETRTLRLKIEVRQDTFALNRDVIEQIRETFKTPAGVAKLKDEDQFDADGLFIAEGQTYLEQSVDVVAQDWPESNSWGVSEQVITFSMRFQIMDIAADPTHLLMTFLRTNAVGSPVTLGNVFTVNDSFQQTRYMELKKIVDRASGKLTMKGEFVSNASDNPVNRRIALHAKLAEMRSQVRGQSGRITYGPTDNRFIDQVVKVDSFEAQIDQARWVIPWTMSASYTIFPNEDGYAAADFKVDFGQDEETGDETMSLTGNVGGASEAIALAKLDALRTAVLGANGFTIARRVSSKLTKDFLNTDDTQNATDNPANSTLPQGSIFTVLSFAETYRRRMSGIENFHLTVVTGEDTKAGTVTITYSGTVIASGATADAAYATAVAKARDLGDNKFDFRLTSRITRNDRKLTNGPQEMVGVEFAFEYVTKGLRVWIEMQTSSPEETFGEDSQRISGFIVAKDRASADDAFNGQILSLFTGQLILGQTFDESSNLIEDGTYAPEWATGGAYVSMFMRLDFSISVHKPKADAFYAFQYGIQVTNDLVALRKTVEISGKLFASPSILAAVEQGTAGNKLDAFLAAFSFGKMLKSTRSFDKRQVGDSQLAQFALDFSVTFIDKLSTAAEILECQVSEAITYSAVRWNFAPIPDGKSVPQDCGIEPGSRSISGSVTALTEASAMAWVKKMKGLPFPTGNGGGGAPTTRYLGAPKIERSFEFLPLEDGASRGVDANFTVTRVSFNFPETLLDFPYVQT